MDNPDDWHGCLTVHACGILRLARGQYYLDCGTAGALGVQFMGNVLSNLSEVIQEPFVGDGEIVGLTVRFRDRNSGNTGFVD